MIKQAIIPLAGLGTRLLPLTSVFPKELLPINGKPGIEYILDECIDAGIKEVIFIISIEYLSAVQYMQRFFIEIMYDGSNYHGWQIQPNSITIQEQLEKAISTILLSLIHI